jgi:hypothetical protein
VDRAGQHLLVISCAKMSDAVCPWRAEGVKRDHKGLCLPLLPLHKRGANSIVEL